MTKILVSLLIAMLFVPVLAEEVEEAPAEKPVVAECAAAENSEGVLLGCSQHLAQVTKGYERALEEWKAFARASSNRLTNVADKEAKTKNAVQKNSSKINELKFKRSKENKRKIKELERENKQLWKKLKAIEKEQANLCKTLSKEGAQKQGELASKLEDLWKSARSSLR